MTAAHSADPPLPASRSAVGIAKLHTPRLGRGERTLVRREMASLSASATRAMMPTVDVIGEAVERIKVGSLHHFEYRPKEARIMAREKA